MWAMELNQVGLIKCGELLVNGNHLIQLNLLSNVLTQCSANKIVRKGNHFQFELLQPIEMKNYEEES